jgi:hypothetical protein
MHVTKHPDEAQPTPKKPYRRNESGYRRYSYSVYGEPMSAVGAKPDWMLSPNKSKALHCAVSRKERPHHLTMIAKRWPELKKKQNSP